MTTNAVLGIDQGGTGTRAAISDFQGHLLGFGSSYGGQHSFQGMEFAMGAVRQASEKALAQAGVSTDQLACIFGGLTGVDFPEEYPLVAEGICGLGLCSNVYTTNDSMIALRGGTEKSYGAVIIAGSGGNCAIRTPQGVEFTYHYYHDSDLQGGGAIGQRAVNAVLRAQTFREQPTRLTQRVLEKFQVPTVDDFLRAMVRQEYPWDAFKELCPIVFEEAYAGDEVAAKILRQFGEGCAEMVTSGLKNFKMTDLEVEVVLSGSVFKGIGPILTDTLTTCIHSVAPKARLVNARYEPVVGAVLLGLEKQGVLMEDSVKSNLDKTAHQLGLIRQQHEG
jgi:N-acetylglucosamine kinase-like BadF-type ATPase